MGTGLFLGILVPTGALDSKVSIVRAGTVQFWVCISWYIYYQILEMEHNGFQIHGIEELGQSYRSNWCILLLFK